MLVAFATQDGVRVNAELRTTPRLDLYEIPAFGPRAFRFRRSVAFDDVANGHGARIRALEGVALVYVHAIGPSAALRLRAHGVLAATSPAGERIDALLSDLLRKIRALPAGPAHPDAEEPAA